MGQADFAAQVQLFVRSVEAEIPVLFTAGEGEHYELGKFGFVISAVGLCLARLCHSECNRMEG